MNNISWAEFKDTISWVRDLAATFAALSAGYIALTWRMKLRREQRERTSYELATKMLRQVFELQDAIRNVRHPWISGQEFVSALKKKGVVSALNASGKQTDDDGQATLAVYEARWQPVFELVDALRATRVEAKVHWNVSLEAPERFGVIDTQLSLLHRTVSNYVSRVISSSRPNSSQQRITIEELESEERILYSDLSNDAFRKELDCAVVEIRSVLTNYLDVKPNVVRQMYQKLSVRLSGIFTRNVKD